MAERVVHLAGQPVDGVQRCARCGIELIRQHRGSALVLVSRDGISAYRYWDVGAAVESNGNGQWLIERESAFDVAARCRTSEGT